MPDLCRMPNGQRMRMEGNIKKILRTEDVSFYRPVVFWSINSLLDEKEVSRQIDEMKASGLGGFIFHARAGLRTPYLSEEWFRMVGVALARARRNDMKVWLYDEYGWPSGFAGGKLLENENHRARFFRYRVEEKFDASAYAVFVKDKSGYKRVNAPCGAKEYHIVTMEISPAYCDILNPELTDEFIGETHEKYYARFKEYFGKELLGFFTDEPQYYRYETPVSAVSEEEYRKAYGEDMKDGVIYLFTRDEEGYPFRVRYYTMTNRLYCENFYRRLHEWCAAHGCLLTGHSVEETLMFTQMWGGADCATSYLEEDIPAIDNLARDGIADISAKSVGSVAMQFGKKDVLTETFGCSAYGVTPKELRLIAEKQYVYGVSLMCQHLYNYTLSGLGKIDCPPSFGRAMPWIGGYKSFNDYFANLGYLIASGEEQTDVALITPMESVYLDYIRLNEDPARLGVDVPFLELIGKLKKSGVTYAFVNEKIAERFGKTENGKLVIGNKSYSQVIWANGREIKSSTLSLLKKFAGEGGTVFAETMPVFQDGVAAQVDFPHTSDFSLLKKPLPISFEGGGLSWSCRMAADGTEFLFLVNENDSPVTVTTEESFSPYDMVTSDYGGGSRKNVVPAKGSLLREKGDLGTRRTYAKAKTATPAYLADKTSDNLLTIDRVCAEKEDGSVVEGYFHGVFERLVKSGYRGKLKVSFRFASRFRCPVKLIVENQKLSDKLFNGQKLIWRKWKTDAGFRIADAVAEKGENVFSYTTTFADCADVGKILYDPEVPESLRNCVAYETGLEEIYISGKFDTEEGYTIKKPSRKKAGDLTLQGMENFVGKATYEFTYAFSGKPVLVTPEGDFTAFKIRVGRKEFSGVTESSVRMEGIEGKHIVKVEIWSTLRNMLGPFYYRGKEESGIGSDAFTLRGGWREDGTNPGYDGKRRLIPFGLRAVKVAEER